MNDFLQFVLGIILGIITFYIAERIAIWRKGRR